MNSGDVPPYADSEIMMKPPEECQACRLGFKCTNRDCPNTKTTGTIGDSALPPSERGAHD